MFRKVDREKHNTQFRSRWVGWGMSELVLTLLELMRYTVPSGLVPSEGGGRCWPSIFSCLSRNCLQVIDCRASGTTFPHGQLPYRPACGIPLKSEGVQWSFEMLHSRCFHRRFHVRFNSLFKCGMSIIWSCLFGNLSSFLQTAPATLCYLFRNQPSTLKLRLHGFA